MTNLERKHGFVPMEYVSQNGQGYVSIRRVSGGWTVTLNPGSDAQWEISRPGQPEPTYEQALACYEAWMNERPSNDVEW